MLKSVGLAGNFFGKLKRNHMERRYIRSKAQRKLLWEAGKGKGPYSIELLVVGDQKE